MLIFANCIEEHKIKINHQNKITEMIIEPIGKMGDIFKEFCSYEKIDIDSFYFCFMERVICNEINARYYLDYFLKKKLVEISTVKRNSNSIKKQSSIICPICGEIAKIKIKDFQISIFGCDR